MMEIGLKIKGEFLDLLPNTVLELEEENPFLQLTNVVQGQYSLPLSVPNTEKNMRLLGYPNLINVKKITTGIEAICVANGQQHSRGQIKIESGQSNLNASGKGTISIYYLFGLADFYKNVEKIYLSDIDLGGDISVPSGNLNANGDGTFWDYVMTVMESGTQQQYNFAIFPVVNDAGLTIKASTNTVINCISYYPNIQKLRGSIFTYEVTNKGNRYFNEVCPFAYLVYVIKKVFAHVGWTVQGDILNDPDFLTIVILYNKPIDWLSAFGRSTNVIWNMRQHVPRIKIGKFLLGLANRFGWWYDFDYRKKVCTIKSRKGVFTNRIRKDFTTKVCSNYNYKINSSDKIHGLVQLGGGGDKPDFSQLAFRGILTNSLQLPTPNADSYFHLYFIAAENAYYYCLQDEQSVYTWQKSTDNNFDYTPKDHSEDISTCCLVPGSVVTPLFIIQPANPYAFNTFENTNRDLCLPTMSIVPDESETESFYICYQYGPQSTMNDNNLANMLYPAGGAGCHNLVGALIKQTALVYEYKGIDNIERGLFAIWWELFLNFMRQREEVTIPVKLELTDVLNMKYTDTVLIRNVEYFIKNPHFTIPVTAGISNIELVRI